MKRSHFALPDIYGEPMSFYEILNKLGKLLNEETLNRKQSDDKLKHDIGTEASAREQADTTLQQNINAETSAREQADTILQQNINAEKTELSELKSELANKLPKSPTNWEPWTAEEQATARERMGIPGDYELIETIDETFDDYTLIERDKEPDGTPYNFARVYVFISLYKDSGQCGNYGTGFAYDADNVNILEYRAELGSKTATGLDYYAFWNFGIGINTVFSDWGNGGDKPFLRTHGNSLMKHNVAKKTCAKIALPAFSGHVKISIWGVRA